MSQFRSEYSWIFVNNSFVGLTRLKLPCGLRPCRDTSATAIAESKWAVAKDPASSVGRTGAGTCLCIGHRRFLGLPGHHPSASGESARQSMDASPPAACRCSSGYCCALGEGSMPRTTSKTNGEAWTIVQRETFRPRVVFLHFSDTGRPLGGTHYSRNTGTLTHTPRGFAHFGPKLRIIISWLARVMS